jgi:4-diphosphocytidyl-2-C-methyl-D-erythritol kinase
MLNFPKCKINLGLSVEEKRGDGFHNVSTVMYPVPLEDVLEMVPSESGITELVVTGKDIPGKQSNNLVLKAYHLLKERFGLPPVKIHLHKVIPTGAGLGGGSSDGAAMLMLCNSLFNLGLTKVQLQNFAKQLGSDCAFFIQNIPALATGKGDHLEPVHVDLSGYYIALVKPQIHISTPEAYAWVKPVKKEQQIRTIVSQPVQKWRELLKNDFEEPVFERYPEIREIKNKLYELGAVYASMTGTGAGVYGLFEQETAVGHLFPYCFPACYTKYTEKTRNPQKKNNVSSSLCLLCLLLGLLCYFS